MNIINKLQVEAIKSGSVIDHIPAHIGYKLLTLFKFTETNKKITIGLNLPSKKIGKKDLIKIENMFLSNKQMNQIAVYAPKATVNYINQYYLIKKIFPTLPKNIENILVCPNNNCISNDSFIKSQFIFKKNQRNNIQIKCKYCEKEFTKRTIVSN